MEGRRNQDIQIRFERVSYRVNEKCILKDISITLNSDEVYLLVGRNGSGKTTFLKIIGGILEPTEGEIYIDGKPVKDRYDLLSISGYVFQNPQTQVIGSTVEEDMAFGLENIGMDRNSMKKKIEKVLKEFHLWEYRSFDPSLLSGGQLQRLAVASVLVFDPPVLLLDEPLSMIDRDGSIEIVKILKRISRGKILVIATHETDMFDFATKVMYISNGIILKEIHEFFKNPPFDVKVPSWIDST
jgi:energy-coupling factor transport system ATP-binding protein